jgi:hypothetical protein
MAAYSVSVKAPRGMEFIFKRGNKGICASIFLRIKSRMTFFKFDKYPMMVGVLKFWAVKYSTNSSMVSVSIYDMTFVLKN